MELRSNRSFKTIIIMNNSQLFIPETIKVGWRQRTGTYDGYLAYVIYYDANGKLRKETSWNNWRGKETETAPNPRLTPKDFKNVPTSGFVLNKGVGGVRESYGWNARNEYMRVWDPRGIEFEISIANLVFILAHTNCVKRQLVGEFVYSWSGKDLVLLPANTAEYKASSGFTQLQGKKIGAKDLTEGNVYLTKKQKEVVYLGRFNYYSIKYPPYRKRDSIPAKYVVSKKRIFIDPKSKSIRPVTSLDFLATDTGVLHTEYAEFIEVFKSKHQAHRIVDIEFVPKKIEVPDSFEALLFNNNKYGSKLGHVQIGPNSFRVVNQNRRGSTVGLSYYANSVRDFKTNVFKDTRLNNYYSKYISTIEEYKAELKKHELQDIFFVTEEGKRLPYTSLYNLQ